MTDFARFCEQIGVQITQQTYLSRGRRIHVRKIKNLRATTAIFMLIKAE